MKEETLIDGLAKPMHMIGIKSSDESIQFSAYIGFGKLLTNPLKTDNGQTDALADHPEPINPNRKLTHLPLKTPVLEVVHVS